MSRFNPLAPLWKAVVGLRHWMYDQKWMNSVQLPIPVISVGNLTMGGTGKTPFIQWLLKELVQMGYHPGVVTRNYGASFPKSGLVTVGPTAPSFYGDESVLLKMNNPEIPIYAGPQKWKSAKLLLQEVKSIDVLLIDDGFQHRRLHRDFDILLLDTSVSKQDYDWPPLGRARESLQAIRRASALVFTKCEQSNEKTRQYLEIECKSHPMILHSEQRQGIPQWRRGRALTSSSILHEGRGLAFCGLGNPESFLKGLQNQGLNIGEFKIFADHFVYDDKSIKMLAEMGTNFDYLVTSEKDFVKLLDWPKAGPPLCVVSLEHQVMSDLEGFRAQLTRHLRKNP